MDPGLDWIHAPDLVLCEVDCALRVVGRWCNEGRTENRSSICVLLRFWKGPGWRDRGQQHGIKYFIPKSESGVSFAHISNGPEIDARMARCRDMIATEQI